MLSAPVKQDVRVLMLMYSKNKDQFLGLAPLDQTRFINGIRLISKEKQFQVSVASSWFLRSSSCYSARLCRQHLINPQYDGKLAQLT